MPQYCTDYGERGHRGPSEDIPRFSNEETAIKLENQDEIGNIQTK